MAWSYSGNPADSDLDELRFKIGDTNIKNPELQNEELQFIIDDLTASGTYAVLTAAIVAVRALLAKVAALIDEKVGDVDVKWSQKYKNFKQLLKDFTAEAAKSTLTSAYAGGISIADKHNQEQNTDRVKPTFTKEFGKNKRSNITGQPIADTFFPNS